MKIAVRFFATIREQAGTDSCVIDMPDGAAVHDLKSRLLDQYPSLTQWLPHTLIALNEKYSSDEAKLSDQDTVAFFPPVSGG